MIGLFVYRYGAEQLTQNGIYAGALTILVIYFLTAAFGTTSFTKDTKPAVSQVERGDPAVART